MRYCYVLPYFDETLNSFSKLLAPIVSELLRRGHEVTILSANSNYIGIYRSIHRAVPGAKIKPGFLNYFFFVLATSFWLKKNRSRFDLIHNLGIGATIVQDVMTAHACHKMWLRKKWQAGDYFPTFFNPLHVLVLLVEGYNYGRNTPVIAVINSLADQIIEFYPQRSASIVVIPNGIPPAPLISPLPRLKSSKSFILSFASNDHRKKGLGSLLEVISLAKLRGKRWELKVIGRDKHDDTWKALVKKLGLENEVVFTGHVANIHDQLASTDVFCLPSTYESFGLVFLEAAQAGLPVVGTKVGVYTELVKDKFAHLPLTLPVDVTQLFNLLSRLESDLEFKLSLQLEIQEAALKYSETDMVENTLRFYDQYFNLHYR